MGKSFLLLYFPASRLTLIDISFKTGIGTSTTREKMLLCRGSGPLEINRTRISDSIQPMKTKRQIMFTMSSK